VAPEAQTLLYSSVRRAEPCPWPRCTRYYTRLNLTRSLRLVDQARKGRGSPEGICQRTAVAVRPTPVGQRIQPRFARGEERNKITVQKIVEFFRCIVRQQDARTLLVGRHPKQRILPADLGDEVVPNPTMTLALKQRMSDRFLDTRGATPALHIRRPTLPPRNHTVFTRRQLMRTKTQLRLEHPSMTQTNGTFTCSFDSSHP